MKDLVTLIIPIRDRDAWRIEKLVTSLRSHGADPRVIVVDYGSSSQYAKEYQTVAFRLGLEYERMETGGWPWNKCHAINRGVRLAESKYVCTVDVDIFFTSNPLEYCLEYAGDKKMFHIEPFWLGKNGDWEKAVFMGRGAPGVFQFIPRCAFDEAGGYDERIVYWGLEDLDWPRRLKELGYEQVWLPEKYKIYHQWHRVSESGNLRPITASYNTMRYCIENRLHPVILQEWGRGIGVFDRPILKLMSSDTPDVVRIGKNALMHYGNLDIVLGTKDKEKFVKLELGPRLVRRPLSCFSNVFKTILRPVTALASLDCDEKANRNFDYFYAMLPVLLANGDLADYFISKDMSEVFLYWKC